MYTEIVVEGTLNVNDFIAYDPADPQTYFYTYNGGTVNGYDGPVDEVNKVTLAGDYITAYSWWFSDEPIAYYDDADFYYAVDQTCKFAIPGAPAAVTVSVNGTILTPDGTGEYSFTVTGDSVITITE